MCPSSEWFHDCESRAKKYKLDFEIFFFISQVFSAGSLHIAQKIVIDYIKRYCKIISKLHFIQIFRALFKIHILGKYHPTSSKWFFFCIVTITKSSFSHFFALSTISCTGMIYQSAKSKSFMSWKPSSYIIMCM